MRFCPVNFAARWSGLAALVLLAVSAAAQQTIQFTKPADEDLSGKPNDFPPASTRRNSAAAFNAPSSLFGDNTPTASFDVLPGSVNQNAISAANAAAWRKFLDGKKNWTLMTPEEILGIPTAEQILGVTDPRDDPNLSAEERFLQRQDRLAAAGATNGLHRPDASFGQSDSPTDPFQTADASRRFAETLGGSIPGTEAGTAKSSNLLFDEGPNPLAGLNQRPDSAWASPFGMPAALPKPTPEQLAGMDRFRALMEPSAPPKAPESGRFSFPTATPNSAFQSQSAFNSAGRPVAALASGISKPKGIAPLPGITGSQLAPAKTAPPLVQPPPWLSDSPQVFTPVQRQF